MNTKEFDKALDRLVSEYEKLRPDPLLCRELVEEIRESHRAALRGDHRRGLPEPNDF